MVPLRVPVCGAILEAGLAVTRDQGSLADLVGPGSGTGGPGDFPVSRATRPPGANAFPAAKAAPPAAGTWFRSPGPRPSRWRRASSAWAPACRSALEGRFHSAAGSLLSAAPALKSPPSAGDLSRWYWGLKLDCPLLEGKACSVYPNRPLACREYFVTGAADQCSQVDSSPSALPVRQSIAHALCLAAAAVEGTPPESLMLPLAPAMGAATPIATKPHLSRQTSGRGPRNGGSFPLCPWPPSTSPMYDDRATWPRFPREMSMAEPVSSLPTRGFGRPELRRTGIFLLALVLTFVLWYFLLPCIQSLVLPTSPWRRDRPLGHPSHLRFSLWGLRNPLRRVRAARPPAVLEAMARRGQGRGAASSIRFAGGPSRDSVCSRRVSP